MAEPVPDPAARAGSGRSLPVVGAGLLLGAVALGVGAGIAAERAVLRRDRRADDPEAAEPFGMLRGTPSSVVTTDGVALHVEELGSGPCLVFSHGFALSQDIWHYQRRDLADRFRCVFYDVRGHGRSGRPAEDDYALATLAEDLLAVVRWTGERRVVLVAHSLAGMVALKLCEQHPEEVGGRIAGLVLVGTTYADALRGMTTALLSRWPERLRRGLVNGAARLAGEDPQRVNRMRARGTDVGYLLTRAFGFGSAPSSAQVTYTDRLLASTDAAVWAKTFPSLTGFDLDHVLASISVPTLVVVGGKDRLTPMGSAVHMAETIPGASLLVLDSAGHLAFMEEHATFDRELAAFAGAVLSTAATMRRAASGRHTPELG